MKQVQNVSRLINESEIFRTNILVDWKAITNYYFLILLKPCYAYVFVVCKQTQYKMTISRYKPYEINFIISQY